MIPAIFLALSNLVPIEVLRQGLLSAPVANPEQERRCPGQVSPGLERMVISLQKKIFYLAPNPSSVYSVYRY
jgi:hypothetical protein